MGRLTNTEKICTHREQIQSGVFCTLLHAICMTIIEKSSLAGSIVYVCVFMLACLTSGHLKNLTAYALIVSLQLEVVFIYDSYEELVRGR